jgi:type VI protein secretion system component Hcp
MKNIPKLLLVLAFLMVAVCARSRGSGDVYYMTLAGINGNARVAGLTNAIAVTGFQYPGVSGSAESFYIEKNFDSSSAQLLLASVTGSTITSGTFYCESALGPVFTMSFGDLIIDAWQSSDMGMVDLVPMEKVSFSFDSLSITTYSQRGGKGGGAPVTTLIFAPPMHN